jgi:mono/diheme cytochrome c family protein
MKRAIIVLVVLIAALLTSSELQAQKDRPKRGLIFAKQVCSHCHSVEMGSPNSPNLAAPRFEDIANTPGMTAMAISAALHTSHRTMPNVMLNADELSNIVAYLLSLKQTRR